MYHSYVGSRQKEILKDEVFPMVDLSLRKAVFFAKQIPGFKSLNMEDQCTLIKGTSTNIMIKFYVMALWLLVINIV